MMIRKFKASLSDLLRDKDMHPAAESNPHILLAVSGGIDSMCMATLFDRLYYKNYAIATVNFGLRGEESDSDEKLVENWAKEHSVRFFSTLFDTVAYSKKQGISTQMAARELRYSWFAELMMRESFDYLAVAHNLNDSVETFFLNILRGTGIEGLTGIKRVNGNIIRPLLGFSRDEIVMYVKKEEIPFRDDRTNFENHYSRNRLRNLVFPEFEEINPSFMRTVEKNMQNVECAVGVLEELYAQKRVLLFDEERGRISIDKLLAEKCPEYWLYLILNEYGFNPLQAEQVGAALTGQPGKEFHSESHILLRDREYLLLYPKAGDSSGLAAKGADTPLESDTSLESERNITRDEIEEERFVLEDMAEVSQTGGDMHTDVGQDYGIRQKEGFVEQRNAVGQEYTVVALPAVGEVVEVEIAGVLVKLSVSFKPAGFNLPKKRSKKMEMTGDLFSAGKVFSAGEPLTAAKQSYGEGHGVLMVDVSKLAPQLHIRKWREGDRFIPLGMSGFKKVSDYLIDIKMDRMAKESQLVVLSGDTIVALAGQRIDDRFKIVPESSKILEISVF